MHSWRLLGGFITSFSSWFLAVDDSSLAKTGELLALSPGLAMPRIGSLSRSRGS